MSKIGTYGRVTPTQLGKVYIASLLEFLIFLTYTFVLNIPCAIIQITKIAFGEALFLPITGLQPTVP